MKFEPIDSSHLKGCSNLFVEVFNGSPWHESWSFETASKRLEDCYATPGFYGIVAIEEDKVSGFALGFAEVSYEGQHFYLKEMCVCPNRQRSGIGTKIIETLYSSLVDKRHQHDLSPNDAR
ncbi:MAG: GNAT family N-acetyltransferase [Leptolyngbya sp. SIOISBB]|nr:GNAT family N-acetyltransferase [Leptolyngbya sp. SIOISBB]